MKIINTVVAFLIVYCVYRFFASPSSGERQLLADVQTLTFEVGKDCKHRRVSAMEGSNPNMRKLVCVNSPLLCGTKSEPKAVSCLNMNNGRMGVDPEWKCTAVLESGIDLGKTEVICEGYDHANDPFILADSCYLEYSLVQTGPRSNYGNRLQETSRTHHKEVTTTTHSDLHDPDRDGVAIFVMIVCFILIFVMVAVLASTNDRVTVQSVTPNCGYGYVSCPRSSWMPYASYSGWPSYPIRPSRSQTVVERTTVVESMPSTVSPQVADTESNHVSTTTASTRRR